MIGSPVQIAYATDDVHAAARRWAERGVGPFFVLEHITVVDVRIDGEPADFDHSSAYAQWGSVMVELIRQHDPGPDPVVSTSGIHHVASFVDDFDVAGDALVADGFPRRLVARTSGGQTFAFHDARASLGHMIEIYERTDRLADFYDMVRDAATDWNGADPIRVL
ncbi:VOC family protein [Ilumatobacter nonamiensis]|uniref:VOC family protein n=1 Tax=Ilumatobacter nonamiensis TaxID=467093 RepID=UPI00034CA661|nr:VOC family protein [Ilumatobacter nonamiensis]